MKIENLKDMVQPLSTTNQSELIEKIAKAHNLAFVEYYSQIPCSTNREISRFTYDSFLSYWKSAVLKLGTVGYENFICSNKDTIGGVISSCPIDKNIIEVDKLYLNSSIRGKGIGKRLMLNLLNLTSQFPMVQVVTDPDCSRTSNFYSSVGFEPVKEEEKELSAYSDGARLKLRYWLAKRKDIVCNCS